MREGYVKVLWPSVGSIEAALPLPIPSFLAFQQLVQEHFREFNPQVARSAYSVLLKPKASGFGFLTLELVCRSTLSPTRQKN